MPGKVWDKITYPFPNFNDATAKVCDWVSHFIVQWSYKYNYLSNAEIEVDPYSRVTLYTAGQLAHSRAT